MLNPCIYAPHPLRFSPLFFYCPPPHDSGYCQKALEQILGIRDMPTVMERSGLRTRNRRGDREQRGLEPIRDLVSQGQLQDFVSVQGATAMWERYETCDGNSFEENKLLLYYMYSPADNKIGPLSIETLALVTGAGRGRCTLKPHTPAQTHTHTHTHTH